MKLIDKMKADLATARKTQDKTTAGILRVLIGEIELQDSRSKKEWTDKDTIGSVRKMCKSLQSMVEYGQKDAQVELDIISEYLPTEMTSKEIVESIIRVPGIIGDIVQSDKPMTLMGRIKKILDSDGRPYNGGVLSKTVMALHNGEDV